MERFGAARFGGDSEGYTHRKLQLFRYLKAGLFDFIPDSFGMFCGCLVFGVGKRNCKQIVIVSGQQGALLEAVADLFVAARKPFRQELVVRYTAFALHDSRVFACVCNQSKDKHVYPWR